MSILNYIEQMKDMYEGERIGTPTKEVTQHGRRIYETPEGNVSEKSRTFFLNGKWLNVPSIHEGKAFTDDQLRFMIKQGQIQPTSVHGSRIEAEAAAASRSDMMKSHTKGFAEGQLVRNTVDGSRPGYQGKNQFTGNNPLNIKQSTYDLIPQIKEDAKTMSQIEVQNKHKIHKKTLKKIKDAENIKFRTTYLPEGTQKKSIPYAERYTAEEKSALYKKVKSRETEEDRIKARERDAKYRDKIYKDYKMEPSSRSVYDDLWKDITRSSKEGNRIKLIEGPKYSSGASYDDFKKRVFLDTKTGEKFNYNTLKNYLDSGKLEGVTYKSVIEPYDLKRKIATSGLREDIQKAYFGEKYQPPKMFRAQNTFHVHHVAGVGVDPFTTQLTFADQNLGLVHNKTFNREWAKLIERNAPLSERKNYLKFVKSKIGPNIAQTLEFPEVGRTRTFGEMGTDVKKLLSHEKFKNIDNQKLLKFLNPVAKTLQDLSPQSVLQMGRTHGCLKKQEGGSIMRCLQTKFKADPEKFLQRSAPLAKGNPNLRKWFKTGRNIARGTGVALAWEAALAPIIAGWAALEGESNPRIINEIFYGIPGIGETEKEEWKRESGGDELAYTAKRIDELSQQEIPSLEQERDQVINLRSNVPGKGYQQRVIEDDIKEKKLELQGYLNTPEFYEGPAGSYVDEAVVGDAFNLADQTTAKIAADKAARKKEKFDWLREHKIYAEPNWQDKRISRMGGGMVGIRKPSAIAPTGGPMHQGLRSLYIDDKDY